MAKGISGKLRGSLKTEYGVVVMKVGANGEQLVEGKHSKTNSRTDGQIVARCRQNNVTAAYSSLKRYLVNLWGEKKPSELYQKFKHANGNKESYALPPSDKPLCVVTNWQVSDGRLESVTNRETGCSTIRLEGLETIDKNTTIGALSKAIRKGMGWRKFDAIEFVVMRQKQDEEGMPYAVSESTYLVLDMESEDKVWELHGESGWQYEDGHIGAKRADLDACGYCWVHVGDGEVSKEWLYCRGLEQTQQEWKREEKWVIAREEYRKRDDGSDEASGDKARGDRLGAKGSGNEAGGTGLNEADFERLKEVIREAVKEGVIEAMRAMGGR